jgi:hypothetical protein
LRDAQAAQNESVITASSGSIACCGLRFDKSVDGLTNAPSRES